MDAQASPAALPEERTYAWSNLPAAATLGELAGYGHRRYAVERFHGEAQGGWGWGHYQGRLGTGVHRQAGTAMRADSVLGWLARRHRRAVRSRRRPPDPCFPATSRPS
jgi:hypothetical protein